MGKTLDSLISCYFSKYTNEKEEDVYSVQKCLEQEIVDEICNEKADEIRKIEEQKRQKSDLRHKLTEFRALIVSGIFLAIAVGLVDSHIFELLLSGCYSSDGITDVTRLLVGVLILSLFIAIILMWIFLDLQGKSDK